MKHTLYRRSVNRGEAAALLLREWSSIEVEFVLGDINEARICRLRKISFQRIPRKQAYWKRIFVTDGINDRMRAAFDCCDVCLIARLVWSSANGVFACDFEMQFTQIWPNIAETDEIIAFTDAGFVCKPTAPVLSIMRCSAYQKIVNQFENKKGWKKSMKVASAHTAHRPHFMWFTGRRRLVATEYYVKPSRAFCSII